MPSQLFGVTDLNPSQERFVSIRMQTWQPAHGPITARCDGEVASAHAQRAQKNLEHLSSLRLVLRRRHAETFHSGV